MVDDASRPDALPISPEIERLEGRRILCVYGADEGDDSLCTTLPKGAALIDEVSGGHHFGGDYEAIAQNILSHARE